MAPPVEEKTIEDPRLKRVLREIRRYDSRPEALIQVLHIVQDVYGYLPLEILSRVSLEMGIPPSRVYGVVTFYHYFSLSPKGEHTCLVCLGTACYVKGAQPLLDAMEKNFGVKPGEVSPDNKLGVQAARCLGCCGLAPAVVLDGEILDRMDPVKLVGRVNERMGTKS